MASIEIPVEDEAPGALRLKEEVATLAAPDGTEVRISRSYPDGLSYFVGGVGDTPGLRIDLRDAMQEMARIAFARGLGSKP